LGPDSHYKATYTVCSLEERDQGVEGKVSGFAAVEKQTVEEALDVADLGNFDMGAYKVDYSIVEVHCQNVVAAEAGMVEGTLLEVVAAFAALAS
jgi:hypothetical protein